MNPQEVAAGIIREQLPALARVSRIAIYQRAGQLLTDEEIEHVEARLEWWVGYLAQAVEQAEGGGQHG